MPPEKSVNYLIHVMPPPPPPPPAPSRHYRKADSQTTLTSTLSSSIGPPSDPASIINGLNRLEPKAAAAAGQHDSLARQSRSRFTNNQQHKDRAMEMEIQQVLVYFF